MPGGQDALLFGWLKTLYPIWARFGPEEMFVSAEVGLAELALSGCSLTSDHLYLYPMARGWRIRSRRRPRWGCGSTPRAAR